MKQLVLVYIVLLLPACGQHPAPVKKETKIDSMPAPQTVLVSDTAASQTEEAPENETATYYIVQVAAGHNFDSLKAISTNAVSILGSRFNMLDRTYKPGKGIIVPDSSDDEMYAGSYYPRRPTEDENFVSIEMSNQFCNEKADNAEMVSIAGMYAAKGQADSVTRLLKDKIPSVKTIKEDVFMGCMH
ncbi:MULTISPECIES: hypothetical protein [Niastella]|uniref:DUF4136 domain-containing protein n=1 Tax=Niastella soli TaxID=2821487 RepID=A0ABS3Z4V0_9BACT|nr:hypothetical protein [Niastella soli]MBO9204762.1 hypothetical protein [Niastella soli]